MSIGVCDRWRPAGATLTLRLAGFGHSSPVLAAQIGRKTTLRLLSILSRAAAALAARAVPCVRGGPSIPSHSRQTMGIKCEAKAAPILSVESRLRASDGDPGGIPGQPSDGDRGPPPAQRLIRSQGYQAAGERS